MSCTPCNTTPSINGQSGGGGAPVSPTLLFSQVPTVTVTDVALNTVLSYNLLANTLDTDGDILVVDLYGDMLSANAGSVWSFGISVNAVVIWFDTSAVFGVSAVRRPWRFKTNITRKSATTLAHGGAVNANNSAAAAINGVGDITTAPQGGPIGSIAADPVVAWGSNQLVDFAVQANIAAGNAWTLRGGFIKLETAP